MDEELVKRFLLAQQFNSPEVISSKEDFLEMIPTLLTILKEEHELYEFFLLVLRHIYPLCLSYVNINELEDLLLKDSLTIVNLQIKKITSQLDQQIASLLENDIDSTSANSLHLIKTCSKVLNSIQVLLAETLRQYQLAPIAGRKLPSILLSVPEMMITVYSHCARKKSIYETQDSFQMDLKNLFSTNNLVQNNYLFLLEGTIDFSDSQDTDILEGTLEKLVTLGTVLLQFEPVRALAVFKTFCSVAIKYVQNLRNTLHVTPAIHAMAEYIRQYLKEMIANYISSEDPCQARKNKLFRCFFKLILNLIEKYAGSLRDSHPCLVNLLTAMYDFKNDQDVDMSTAVEAAANNLTLLCFQDPYFINELHRTNKPKPGFITLCVLIMRKILESDAEEAMNDENNMKLIELVINNISHMETKDFIGMLDSEMYNRAVVTTSGLGLTQCECQQLETVLFKNLLGVNLLGSLFATDVWCILLNSGPKSLFEATCVFLVEYASSLDRRVYNFQFINLVAMLRRCLRDVKPNSAKKMFTTQTLSYEKYPILLRIAPDHLPCNPPFTPTLPHSHPFLSSLPSTLNGDLLIQTLNEMNWQDPCAGYLVDVISQCLQANLLELEAHSVSKLLHTILEVLARFPDQLTWLNALHILSTIPARWVCDVQITEQLFTILLGKMNDSDDYVNQAITNYIQSSAKAEYLDKVAFRKALKKSDKVTLVQQLLMNMKSNDVLSQLGNDLRMQCRCEPHSVEDVDMKLPENMTSSDITSGDSSESPSNGAVRVNEQISVKENETFAANATDTNVSKQCEDNIQGVTNIPDVPSNIQGELKSRDNVPDLNKTKRIKLEQTVQQYLETEKILVDMKQCLDKITSRNLSVANREMLIDLDERISNFLDETK